MGSKGVAAIFLFFFLPVVFNLSCTKLGTKVHDKVTDFWQTTEQIDAGVAPAYTWLRSFAPTWWGDPNGGVYLLNETSTDEIIVPDRGAEWAGVLWEQMWKHTWSPNHTFVNDGWRFIYGGTARVNSILQLVSEIDP